VLLRGFVAVVLGMEMVSMGQVSMMSGGLVMALLMVRSGFVVVLRGVFVV